MDLRKNLTPALLAYDGIQYTYMAPAVFEDGQYDYVQEYLRILSGFYGVVKPMDGVVPYRLEMQAKAAVGGHKNLYDFWGDSLYREVIGDSRIVINLASKEYSKCIEKYLQPGDLEIPVKEGRRSAPTVRLVRFYRCEAPPSIVKSLDACLYSVLLGLVNGLIKK